jgi:aminoglycoside 3-N-acetyltransferase I
MQMNMENKITNDSIEIKRLGKQDVNAFQQLLQLFHDVFEMEETITSDAPHLETLLAKEDFIVYAAFSGNEVAGGLTAYELPMYYFKGSEVFIYDIAVAQNFQRKGLGKKLIEALEKYCKQKNISVMFVEAHEEDTHAIDFYHSTGGKAEKVVHFNYSFEK